MPIRVSVCLNSGPGKGKAHATILLKSNSTESLLSIAANKLRLTKKDVSIAKLYVWQSALNYPDMNIGVVVLCVMMH